MQSAYELFNGEENDASNFYKKTFKYQHKALNGVCFVVPAEVLGQLYN